MATHRFKHLHFCAKETFCLNNKNIKPVKKRNVENWRCPKETTCASKPCQLQSRLMTGVKSH